MSAALIVVVVLESLALVGIAGYYIYARFIKQPDGYEYSPNNPDNVARAMLGQPQRVAPPPPQQQPQYVVQQPPQPQYVPRYQK